MVQHDAFAVVELSCEFVEQMPVVTGLAVGRMLMQVADGLELLVVGIAEVVYDGVVRDLVYPG